MKLIKDNRVCVWIPLDKDTLQQTRRGKHHRQFGYVEFEGTKEELAIAKRLGRPTPRHQAWVSLSSMTEHNKK